MGVAVSSQVELVVTGSIDAPCHWIIEGSCIVIIFSLYCNVCKNLRMSGQPVNVTIVMTTKVTYG